MAEAWFEAGSIKVALETKQSRYEKVLGIAVGGGLGLDRDVAGFADLPFVVLRDMLMYRQSPEGPGRRERYE